jgi:hypothetical protein
MKSPNPVARPVSIPPNHLAILAAPAGKYATKKIRKATKAHVKILLITIGYPQGGVVTFRRFALYPDSGW